MDYKQHYNKLIETRKRIQHIRKIERKDRKYFEEHHIIPRCMGGTNGKQNLLLLTAREHFVAHMLLWKIYKTKEMAYAVIFFRALKDKRSSKLNSRHYEYARKLFSLMNSGENNPRGFLGKTHTPEVRERMRVSKVGTKNPMYGLGKDHPNCRRLGEKNPNFGLPPWKNSYIRNNPRKTYLWGAREYLFGVWTELNRPGYWAFQRKARFAYTDGSLYKGNEFRNVVNWFRRQDTINLASS